MVRRNKGNMMSSALGMAMLGGAGGLAGAHPSGHVPGSSNIMGQISALPIPTRHKFFKDYKRRYKITSKGTEYFD